MRIWKKKKSLSSQSKFSLKINCIQIIILISEEPDKKFPEKTFKFSVLSLVCPKFCKDKAYDEALNNLYEYMDIHNIIKRLQDVDKLKLVLLDENQRRVFDNLPKPGIIGRAMRSKSVFTMETINKGKKQGLRRRSKAKYEFLLNGDPVNQRIFNMIEPTLKMELKQMHESKMLSPISPGPQDSQIGFPMISKSILKLQIMKESKKTFTHYDS